MINKKGFTLIEIMVAVGIVMILSAISWAAIVSYQPAMVLSATARDLLSDLRLAQQYAVSEQVNYGIFVSTTTMQYRLDKFATTTQTIFLKNLPSGIIFCQTTNLVNRYVEFNPYGSVVSSGLICLSNPKGQTKDIDIKPSGFVKIKN